MLELYVSLMIYFGMHLLERCDVHVLIDTGPLITHLIFPLKNAQFLQAEFGILKYHSRSIKLAS